MNSTSGSRQGDDQPPNACSTSSANSIRNTNHTDPGANTEQIPFIVLLKNVMSILTEEREQILFRELETIQWDVVLVNETWRECKEEIWTISGHLFLGSGGTRGSKGVAILLHRRWVKGFRAFHAISERLCALDLNIRGKQTRTAAVYMPTSWHDDSLVESVYQDVSKLCVGARRLKRKLMLFGDFNAVVGRNIPGDESAIVGSHGLGLRNDRGQWLVDWASSESLAIVNTLFRKPVHKLWTHTSDNIDRQIDFGMFQRVSWLTAVDSEATQDISLGVDHRCLRVQFRLSVAVKKHVTNPCHSTAVSFKSWKPEDAKLFMKTLDEKLENSLRDETTLLIGCLNDRCKNIENLLLAAGRDHHSISEIDRAESCEQQARLRELIQERRQARAQRDRPSERMISKSIQKEYRAIVKARRQFKISKILSEFRGLKYIAGIKDNGKRTYIGSVVDSQGVLKEERQDVADVFADFYAALYKDDGTTHSIPTPEVDPCAPDLKVSVGELRTQLKAMSNGKCPDTRGVVAELLKHASDSMLEIIAATFNDILKVDADTPEYWKETRLKVLFKKGDSRKPGNYRPISILPILYKLFSKILCGKVKSTLLEAQSVDQAGFRPGFSCDDHLFTMTLLIEMHGEFRLPLWVVAVDFQKAFDTVNHPPLWASLLEQGVQPQLVNALMRIYLNQSGTVQTDRVSKPFSIGRGVRQGDPISPILFNAALEKLMRALKKKWSSKRWGVKLGTPHRLQNLRFADDLLLIGRTLHQARGMLEDLIQEAKVFGLEVHMDKTKVMWNGIGQGTAETSLSILGKQYEILDSSASTMYLGRMLCLSNELTHDVELKNRMAKGWAKFAVYRDELTNPHYSLKQRMRVFTSVIQPSILYGCVSWTMTAKRVAKLRTTQRRMLRKMIDTKRQRHRDLDGNEILENYVDWMQRSTRRAEQVMSQYGVPDWVEESCRRKFKWAGQVWRHSDGRWASQVVRSHFMGSRRSGRPLTRWSVHFDKFFDEVSDATGERLDWTNIAQNKETWQSFEDEFVSFIA
jgi:hypothetical protein